MKKTLLPLVLLCCIVLAGCKPAPAQVTAAPDAPTNAPTQAPAETVLTVISLDNTQKDYTLDELRALPAATGQAGIKSSTGKITAPLPFSGVLLTDLLAQAGAAGADVGIEVEAKDGYTMTFSLDQVASGDFITYDPGTGDETKAAGTLRVLLAYDVDGKPLDTERDGILRLVVISEKNNQVTDGHWSIKWVRKITVKQLAQEWDLAMEGGIVDALDRGSFESCSQKNCHAASWTDDKAQVWTGTPLWLIAGRMDDEIKHGDGSFNQALADQGYTVEVIGKDGYSAEFAILELIGNRDIILASEVNGNPLNEDDFPLRLVGSGVDGKHSVGGITKIILHFVKKAEATPTETTSKPPDQAISLPEGKAFLINGLVGTEQSWTIDELKAMDLVTLTVEHPKKGAQEVTGVLLNTLLDAAGVKAEARNIVFTAADGYTITAELTAVQSCSDCLLTLDDSGSLRLSMPSMESSFWVKDLIAFSLY